MALRVYTRRSLAPPDARALYSGALVAARSSPAHSRLARASLRMERVETPNGPAATCRLCLKNCAEDTQQWELFRTDLAHKIMAFAAVQVQENDGLPKIICTNCRNLVYMSYDFKCQVEKSDHDLRQALIIKQSTQWPAIPIVKSDENLISLGGMVPCLQKNINSNMSMQNQQSENNHEQFIFDIANSCNIENQMCKKEEQVQSNDSVEAGSMNKNSSSISIGVDNPMLNRDHSVDTMISFEPQYHIKNDIRDEGNIMKLELEDSQNSNQSEDEKPLILRTKRHKCNYCIKSFANLSLLEKHAVIHKRQPRKVYVCYLCDEEFPSVDVVKNHAMIIHNINMDREQIMQNAKMRRITGWVKKINDKNEEDLSVKNMEDKKSSKFTCEFCFRQFGYHKLFKAHMRTHPNYRDKLLNELNKRPVEAEETAATNLREEFYPISEDDTEQPMLEPIPHPENMRTLSQPISIENNSLRTNIELVSHPINVDIDIETLSKQTIFQGNLDNNGDAWDKGSIDESEEDDGDDFDDDFDDDDENDEMDKNENMPAKNIQCNECGIVVSSLKSLKRHILIHSEFKHRCSICKEDFLRSDELRKHRLLTHQDKLSSKSNTGNESLDDSKKVVTKKKKKRGRPHQCSLCPKAFAQAQSLANHLERHRRAQEVPKRYLCEVCSKCFAQSGSLVAHMRTHTGVKPYVCNICSRAFTKSTYLQLHLRTHSGEKPYICQYCNRAFARANTLARHLTMHTGEAKYQCQICFKSFRRLTSLNEHTYTHTGQRPYACKICSKRYNNAGSLYAHTKKCKTLLAKANTETNYSISQQSTDSGVIPQSDTSTDTVPQFLIFTDKKLDEPIVSENIAAEPSTCQFMITNIHSQKPITTNILETFTIQEADIYNISSKQFKTSYYGLYPSM